MVSVEYPVTYWEAIRFISKSTKKLTINGELNPIGRNNNWTQTVLRLGKDAIPCKVILKRDLTEQGRIACYKTFSKDFFCCKACIVERGWSWRTVSNTTWPSLQSFRLMCPFSFSEGFHHLVCLFIVLDISTAFLKREKMESFTCDGTTTALSYRRVCMVWSKPPILAWEAKEWFSNACTHAAWVVRIRFQVK